MDDIGDVGTVKLNLLDPTDPDSWKCVCGNDVNSDGFQPCNGKGKAVEPTPKKWDGQRSVCMSCGRVIDQKSRIIVGRKL